MTIDTEDGVALEDMDADQLRDFIAVSTERVMEIDAQLSIRMGEKVHRNKVVRDGYWEWRGRAVAAKNYAVADLVAAKSRLRTLNNASAMAGLHERSARRDELVPGVEDADVLQILRHVVALAHEFIDASGIDLSPAQKVVLSCAHKIMGAR